MIPDPELTPHEWLSILFATVLLFPWTTRMLLNKKHGPLGSLGFLC